MTSFSRRTPANTLKFFLGVSLISEYGLSRPVIRRDRASRIPLDVNARLDDTFRLQQVPEDRGDKEALRKHPARYGIPNRTIEDSQVALISAGGQVSVFDRGSNAIPKLICDSHFGIPCGTREPPEEGLPVLSAPPSVLWQTYITKEDDVPKVVSEARAQWKRIMPELNYSYMSDGDMEFFMRSNFESRIFQAFERMPKGVMKADFWRYAVIYKHGGLYADVDVIPHRHVKEWLNWTDAQCSMFVGLENDIHISNWAFAAVPDHPALKQVIDLIVARAQAGINTTYEHYVHYHTGPGAFTDGILQYAQKTQEMCNASADFTGYNGTEGFVKVLGSNVCIKPVGSWRGHYDVENLYGSRHWNNVGYHQWIPTTLLQPNACKVPKNLPCACFL